jgi:uncharacterized membrane protein YhaH (DUF805 family)
MSAIDWYQLAWKRAFDIKGRSRRKEFGYFLVPNMLILILLAGAVIALADSEETITWVRSAFWLCLAAIIVPKTTLTIRRLHDIELPGWLFLLGLVPFAGLVLDMFCLLAGSNPRPNKWGVSPKFEETQRWMASSPLHAQRRG